MKFKTVMTDRMLLSVRSLGHSHISMNVIFSSHIDVDILQKSFLLSLDVEPICRSKIVSHWWRPYWKVIDLNKAKNFQIFSIKKNELDKCLQDYITKPIDPFNEMQVHLALFQLDTHDVLSLKITHEVTDAISFKDYVYKLALIYTQLEKQEDINITSNIKADRSLKQLFQHTGFSSGLLSMFKQGSRDIETLLEPPYWIFPFSKNKNKSTTIVIHSLSDGLFPKLKEYTKGKKYTITDVILACYYRALYNVIKPSRDTLLRVRLSIDLRRFIPSGKTEGICNLPGFVYTNIGTNIGKTLLDTIDIVHDFISSAKQSKSIGLGDCGNYIRNFDWKPFLWSEKSIQKTFKLLTERGVYSPILTNMGAIETEKLKFGSSVVKDAYLLTPIFFSPTLVVGFSTYSNNLVFSSGLAGTDEDKHLVESLFRFIENEITYLVSLDEQ